MTDLERSIRDAAERYEPPADWLERIHRRARTKRRNQRLLAATVGLVGTLAIIVPLVWEVTTHEGVPADQQRPAGGGRCAVSIPITNWWQWEGSGADAIGGQDVELHGDATFEPGFIGQALTLDRDGDFASLPDDPTIEFGSGDFTFMLWVRFDRSAGEQVMLEKWVQRFERPSTGWSFVKRGRRVALFMTPPLGGGTSVEVDVPENTWVHFAVHRSGATVRILMNGTVMVTAPDLAGDLDSASSLKFGHRGGLDDTAGAQLDQGFFLQGQIDEVMFNVDRALSPDEIETIYREQLACAE